MTQGRAHANVRPAVGQSTHETERDNMRTNDLKKGMRVRLANGWYATVADNALGNTRLATVEGIYTETGSVYAHDIAYAVVDGAFVAIEHTAAQKRLRDTVRAAGL